MCSCFFFFLTETLTLHHLSLPDWGYVNIAKNTVTQVIGQKFVDFFKWRTLHLEPSYVLNGGPQFKLSAQAYNSFMTDNCYFDDGCFIFTIVIKWQPDTFVLLLWHAASLLNLTYQTVTCEKVPGRSIWKRKQNSSSSARHYKHLFELLVQVLSCSALQTFHWITT